MRLDVRYRTAFAYSESTSESQNELRACPTSDACQRLLDYRVTVEPGARVYSYLDAWGTRVDTFGIRRHHTSMAVTAEASVETRPRPLPTAAPRTESLRRGDFVEAHIEYLQRDQNTDWGAGVADVAQRQLALAGPDVVGAILAIHRFVGTNLDYRPGATDVGIEVEDVLAGGHGVCQDFAHLAVSMCRSLGIPARYVSGYLFTDRDDAGDVPIGDTVVVQTHAWMEAAVPGWGWLALDPTNGQVVGEHHVKIGHGRSYDDVQPLRGVFLGPAESSVHPVVEIRRVDGSELWRTPQDAMRSVPLPPDVPMGGRRSALPGTGSIRQQQLQQQQASGRTAAEHPRDPAPPDPPTQEEAP